MFSVSGDAVEETMDGCPVVRVHDNADDMANLLRRLYCLESIGARRSPSLELISSIMGLAFKYVMIHLRQELIDYLLDIFPTNLHDYPSFSFFGNPLLGVDIGLKYDVPAIVPVACYRAALLDSEQIFDGFRRPDGTSTVSAAARALCMRLKGRLILWIKGKTYEKDSEEYHRPAFLPHDQHPCPSGTLCGANCPGKVYLGNSTLLEDLYSRYCELAFDIFSSDEREFDPYANAGSIPFEGDLCSHCLCLLRDSGDEFRCVTWNLLPMFCDIEGAWHVLRDHARGIEPPPTYVGDYFGF
ncbi:hypothetical protein OF83DRAFT_464194 [Amylostereum chailletii]|nr:hypothetical protein OF83DRAFT_464194 [Amylostereum chailletii]